MSGINQPILYGFLKKLLLVKAEDQVKRMNGLHVEPLQKREELRSLAGRIAGSLVPLLLALWGFEFREAVFGRTIWGIILPDAVKKIVKGANAGVSLVGKPLKTA